MTVILEKLADQRVSRTIDWAVFASGATSLVFAIAMTVLNVLTAEPAVADPAAQANAGQPVAVAL